MNKQGACALKKLLIVVGVGFLVVCVIIVVNVPPSNQYYSQ
jgi:hypothetical protein